MNAITMIARCIERQNHVRANLDNDRYGYVIPFDDRDRTESDIETSIETTDETTDEDDDGI